MSEELAADVPIVTLEDALATCARLRDRAHEAESLVEYWHDVARDGRDEVARVNAERAALVQQIERMRGEHWARVMDVVRAAQAWRHDDGVKVPCFGALCDAVDAYERG